MNLSLLVCLFLNLRFVFYWFVDIDSKQFVTFYACFFLFVSKYWLFYLFFVIYLLLDMEMYDRFRKNFSDFSLKNFKFSNFRFTTAIINSWHCWPRDQETALLQVVTFHLYNLADTFFLFLFACNLLIVFVIVFCTIRWLKHFKISLLLLVCELTIASAYMISNII